MHEQPTCGKGLAENATLPAAVAELMDATVLEAHVGTLDPADASARREEDAYRGLVDEHRTIARALRAAAARRTGYRDLPMGRHDPAAMAAPSRMRTFETFVGKSSRSPTCSARASRRSGGCSRPGSPPW